MTADRRAHRGHHSPDDQALTMLAAALAADLGPLGAALAPLLLPTVAKVAAAQAGPPAPERHGVLIPLEEAARLLGIGRTKTYQLVGEGTLESVRVGRRRLIPRDAVDRYVTTLRSGAPPIDAAARAPRA